MDAVGDLTRVWNAPDPDSAHEELRDALGVRQLAGLAEVTQRALNGSPEAVRRYLGTWKRLTTAALMAARHVEPERIVFEDGHHLVIAHGHPLPEVDELLDSAAAAAPFTPWVLKYGVGEGVALSAMERVAEVLALAGQTERRPDPQLVARKHPDYEVPKIRASPESLVVGRLAFEAAAEPLLAFWEDAESRCAFADIAKSWYPPAPDGNQSTPLVWFLTGRDGALRATLEKRLAGLDKRAIAAWPVIVSPTSREGNRFQAAVHRALADAETPMLDRVAEVFGLSDVELGAVFGVRRQAIRGWRTHGVPTARQAKLTVVVATADLLARTLRTERIPGIARRKADAYGGSTMLEMISADRHVELLELVRASFDWSAAA